LADGVQLVIHLAPLLVNGVGQPINTRFQALHTVG
jgi:hypothetical protein